MKRIYLFPLSVIIIFLNGFSLKGYSQSAPNAWTVKMEPQKVFVENQGQFPLLNKDKIKSSDILYAYDEGPTKIYFTRTGVIYTFNKTSPKKIEKDEDDDKDSGKPANHEEEEKEEHAIITTTDIKYMNWENANPNVEVVADDPATGYFSYGFYDNTGTVKNINYIKGYNKITYKNLYPNIDVEYVFHPDGGIKYTLILHPGADIAKVGMNYSGNPKVKNNGDLHINTLFGDIIDHAPHAFYSDNKSIINSFFVKTNNTISIKLDDAYDNSKTVIIDPWVVTPALANSHCVWECDKDGSGNVYIIGGDVPLTLQKYTSAGVWVWTYATPYDTSSGDWLGTLATDLAGNSYVTNGSTAALLKVNTGGGMVYSVTGGSMDEYWNIAFNCDQTKLIIAGTRLTGIPIITGSGQIFDINAATGSVNSMAQVGWATPGPIMGNDPDEARSVTSCRNARYYYLTLDSIGCVDQNIGVCPSGNPSIFKLNSGYGFAYKMENYRPNNGNAGIMSIRANRYFLYTANGTNIEKRSLATGAVLNTAAIPGGVNTTTLGFHQIGNSGIDIDTCGNVYVGSANGLYEFDANLTPITSVATTYSIYDVKVSYGGNVIVAGATGDNSSTSRTGYVQSFNMGACNPMTLYCCDANICPAGPFCSTASPVNLTAATTGGTWSGTGITNISAGTFSPSVAGPGIHTIYYTLACGTDSINITVNACATLSVCTQTGGDLTVSGGTAPYTWQYLKDSLDCSSCPLGTCIPPICNGTVIQIWTTFATGTTVPPPTPSTDTIRVTDGGSNSLVIYSIASLPSCSPCPPLTVTPASIVEVKCFGGATGSFSASTTGGTSPYNYTLMNGLTTIVTYTNITGSQSFTGLAAGTYTLDVSDHNGCPDTITVTITQPASAVTASITGSTQPACGVSNGSATAAGSGGTSGYTYSWNSSPVQTTATASNLHAGIYTVTVTDANGCTATASVTLTNPNAPVLTISTVNATCGMNNGSATVIASGGTAPYTYLWSSTPPQTTSTASNLGPGTYYVTVTDHVNCTSIDTAIVIDTSSFSASAGANQSICKGGSATLTATGGTTYQWSTGASTATINVTPTVTTLYTVTVSNSICTATANVTVIVNPIPVATITGDSLLCKGMSEILTAHGGTSYIWNNSDTTAAITISPATQTSYTVTVTRAGCTATASITVNLENPPTAHAWNDTIINIGGSAQLHGSGGISYSWSPSTGLNNPNIANPTASPLTTTYYILVVTDSNGCTSSDTVKVTVEINCGDVFVPNAFSPDNGNNALECVYGNCIESMEFSIYDRWGEKVFSSTDLKTCWDGTYKGKKMNTGVFVYYLKANLYNGSEITKKGNVNLFR